MMKTSTICIFLFLLVLFPSTNFGQVLQRDRDARGLPPNENPNEYNPFSEGVDSLYTELEDTTNQLIFENTDTINYAKVIRKYDLNLVRSIPQLSLDSVSDYQPVMRTFEPSVNLGNNGLPILSLSKKISYSSDFQMGLNSLDLYKIKDDDVNYYQAQRPFTRLFYVTGSRRENDFQIEHTQNWGRGINMGVEYRSLVSNGFYENQAINHKNLAVHFWYQGKRKHFNSMAHYINNLYKIGTNGGIEQTGVDYYNNEDFDERRNIPVNLASLQRKGRDRRFFWQTSYDFGKNVDVQINDSIRDTEIVPRFRIQYQANYITNKNYLIDEQLDNTFFGPNLILSDKFTADTTHYTQLINEFRMKWLGNKLGDSSRLVRKNFLADAYTRFSTNNVYMREAYHDQFTDLVVGGNIRSNPLFSDRKIIYKGEAAYHLSDYRQGDYYVRGEIGIDFPNTGSAVGFVEWSNQEQIYTANHFWQTYYQVDQNLDKTNARAIGGVYTNDKWKFQADGRYVNATNMLWFDSSAQSHIVSSPENYFFLHAKKDIEIKQFHLDLHVYYQNSTSSEAVNLPNLISKSEFYFKGPMFKNNVTAKMGFSTFWNSKYTAPRYNPSIDQFLYQGSQEIANHTQIDFFTNFSLSRARAFLRLDNLGSLFFDQPIYQSVYYPQHDIAFRAGINWVFIN